MQGVVVCSHLFLIVVAFQLLQLQTIPLATNSGSVLLIFYPKIDETRMVPIHAAWIS
jgi:hypothetical protein